MLVQMQYMERLYGGASAYIYAVNEQIVLKAPVTFVPPADDASPGAHYEYASATVSYHEDVENERSILQRLAKTPHPNIVQAISLDYPEGVYLQRHTPLSENLQSERPGQSVRLGWYRDMLSALVHLHDLEIAHADIRLENFLYHSRGAVVLCDFSCSRPFGQVNPAATISPETVGVNGAAEVVSDVTDMFALASVMFRLEMDAKPGLEFVDDTLKFPDVKSGNEGLDLIIMNAWLEKYKNTKDMLADIRSLSCYNMFENGSMLPSTTIEILQTQVQNWRRKRQREYGAISIGEAFVSPLLTFL